MNYFNNPHNQYSRIVETKNEKNKSNLTFVPSDTDSRMNMNEPKIPLN